MTGTAQIPGTQLRSHVGPKFRSAGSHQQLPEKSIPLLALIDACLAAQFELHTPGRLTIKQATCQSIHQPTVSSCVSDSARQSATASQKQVPGERPDHF